MKPEEQRIAIAEACGWTVHHGGKYVHPKSPRFRNVITDPLDDLNAMHEAEKVLTIPQGEVYWLTLCRDVVPLNDNAWHANAAQRAEAFLKTLGLWRDKDETSV